MIFIQFLVEKSYMRRPSFIAELYYQGTNKNRVEFTTCYVASNCIPHVHILYICSVIICEMLLFSTY